MSEIIREVNAWQTPITAEELSKYPEEVVSEFWEYVNSVPFISNLISKDRRRAKDMPKDELGKIIIDFTNPHILEDMDYFRETAIYFEKHGEYTNLRINTHPQSEYMKWLRREIERCWYGMVRPSDGEWITGDFYFYLNYSIMKQTVIKKLPDGREIITRKEDLPKVWEGVYLRMHYLNQAKVKFMHAAEISSRGKSKSYTIASLLTKMTSLGIAQGLDTERASLAVASNKDYLTKKGQGVLEKVMDNFDHLREHTQFPSRFSQDSYTTMNWVLGSETVDGKAVGPQNTLAGVSIADDPDKSRGSRTDLLLLDEFGVFPKFTEWWGASMPNVQEGDLVFGFAFATGCVCKDTPVWNAKGQRIAIQDIEDTIIGCKDTKANIEPVTYHQPEAYKPCFRIHTEYRTLECSEDHPIMKRFKKSRRTESYLMGNKREYWWEYNFVPTKELKVGDKLAIMQEVDIFSEETLFDARLVGMLIGDGSYGTSIRASRNNITEVKTPVFSNCEKELLDYVENNYETSIEKAYVTKDGRDYREIRISNLLPKLREVGIAGQSKLQKRLPTNYQLLSKRDSAELLAGLFDTDGCVTDRTIFLTQSHSELLEEVKILLLKFGVHSYIFKEEPRIRPDRKDRNPWYKLIIGDAVSLLNFIDKIPLIVEDKIQKMATMKAKMEAQEQLKKSSDGYRIETITRIEDIGIQRVYNLTADDSNTYLANEIITHNTGGCVCAGTKVYDKEGYVINIEDVTEDTGILGYSPEGTSVETISYIQEEQYKECIEIECENEVKIQCSLDHPILSSKPNYYMKQRGIKKIEFTSASEIQLGDHLMLNTKLNIEGTKDLRDAELIGLLIGDGNYSTENSNISLSVLGDELYRYLDERYSFNLSKISETKSGENFAQISFPVEYKNYLRELGIFGQKGSTKTLPVRINQYNNESISALLRGYFEADGDVKTTKSGNIIRLTSKNTNILEEVKVQLLKFGINSNIRLEKKGGSVLHSHCNNTSTDMPEYLCGVLSISRQTYVARFIEHIGFITEKKNSKLANHVISRVEGIYDDCRFIVGKGLVKHKLDDTVYSNLEAAIVKKITPLGMKRIYNLTADVTNTYICNNIVTHNTEGSNFMGALDMIDNPKSKNVLGIPNLFDKGSTGKRESIFFFPSYMNYAPYYNHDGVSDIVKSILVELNVRYVMKYNSKDPMQVTQRRAEFAFTLQDAIMRTSSTIYPVADLVDTIQNIDNNPEIQQALHVGRIELKDGKALWRIDPSLTPITSFPHKDNKSKGAIVIKTHPIADSNGDITPYRYIGGADTIETDGAETLSLFSGFILDLWTDQIVAEYTGREDMVDDSFEIFRRLLIYYNAIGNYESNKKGLFGHFSKHNSLHLLSDTLDFLKDRDPQKIRYGNAAKGTPSSKPIKDRGKILIRDYLLKPIETVHINKDTGEEYSMSTYTLKEIPFKALLQELSMHNEDGNFDRHDALVQLMLLREDRLRILGDSSFEERYGGGSLKDYIGNDEFFTKNYPGSKHENSQDMFDRLNRTTLRKR